MKKDEIKNLSVEELNVRLSELEEEQLRLRCNKATHQLDNVSLIRQGRRNIARVKTIINEKKI